MNEFIFIFTDGRTETVHAEDQQQAIITLLIIFNNVDLSEIAEILENVESC